MSTLFLLEKLAYYDFWGLRELFRGNLTKREKLMRN